MTTSVVQAAPQVIETIQVPQQPQVVQSPAVIVGTQTMVQEMAPLTRTEAQIVGSQIIQGGQLAPMQVQGAVMQGTTEVVPGGVSTRQVPREVVVPQIQTVEKLIEVPQVQTVEKVIPVPQVTMQ